MDTTEQVKSLARLREHHLRELRESGLSDETIISSGIYSETSHGAICAILGRQKMKRGIGSALVIPFREVSTGELNGFKRLKLDCPRTRDGRKIKYESPAGSTPHVYVPAGTVDHLQRPESRLLFVEGEKKSLAADQFGFPCIGLVGVFGWKPKKAERLLPELEIVEWNGRDVLIVFDSDVSRKPEVADASARLAAQLKLHGAKVKVVLLPDEPDGAKNGLDDFLVRHGKDEFYKLIAQAAEPEPVDAGSVKVPASEIDPVQEARRILRQLQDGKHNKIRHHRGEFWRYTGGRYLCTTDDEVVSAVYTALDPFAFKITRSAVANVISALKAETQLPDAKDAPFWLDDVKGSNRIIALQNGLVDLGELIETGTAELRPHTAAWFSPVRLPYRYDPAADCLRWKDVVHKNLRGDEELADLWQEWCGLCLVPAAAFRTTTFQKFVVLEGEGNNGKSVFLSVLRGLVGVDNVSAVPLEMFGSRFSLIATLGKLVNVVAECGEIDKVAEGHLKAFTAGDAMQFEQKHKPAFMAVPTARLVLATNNRPRFSDKSGGLWRRMLLIPMEATIADADRVIGMDTVDWWMQADQFPGVFNWAVEGLRRLMRNNGFTVANAVTEAVDEYKRDMNPARLFLEEHYATALECHVVTADVYSQYQEWCKANGYMPLGSRMFGKEIRRTFPHVRETQVSEAGLRKRGYQGIGTKPASDW
jgi:P4 family phage/plasmid primase-like protien